MPSTSSTRTGNAAARAVAAGLAGVVAAVGLAACRGGGHRDPGYGGPAYTLRVLGGSELADMKPVLDRAAKATGVTVKLTATGTLDGTETVTSGKADGAYDALWFSSNRYLALYPDADRKLATSTKIMSSPVVLGVKGDTAHRLGWDSHPVTWADIATAAGNHAFSYGMTNPAHSNSGFSALLGVATALAGTGGPLDAAQVARATPALRAFFGAQALSAGSSGWLSDAYRRRESGGGPPLDGLVNYESVLLSLNRNLRQPLTLIYPTDGVVTADYPLTLLASAPAAARNAYRRLVRYLRSTPVQRQIRDTTWRRPAVPGVPLTRAFTARQLFELPFPNRLDVVNSLLATYFDQLRRPARTVYVLDTSGSMAGDRLAQLKAALAALTGADSTLSGQFDRFHGREQVTMLPFDTRPRAPTTFAVPERDQQPVLDQIRAYGDALAARGNTALYDALVSAYDVLRSESAADPDRITSIVLLTDGESNTGRGLADFTASLRQLPPAVAATPVFPVLVGEADADQMAQVAMATGGQVFDAHGQSLADAFAAIRGYQ